MEIVPIEEHALLLFFVQFTLLLALARSLGALMVRIGQPSVVGEIGAGVLLGPTLLGRVWPEGAAWLFPPEAEQSAMILVVGWVGILLLLLLTGFETDLDLIRQSGRAAVLVSTGSIAVPFVFGLALGGALPGDFLGEGTSRTVFALFLATALSISWLPVIAKILGELGLTRRTFGQLTIAAGMANDWSAGSCSAPSPAWRAPASSPSARCCCPWAGWRSSSCSPSPSASAALTPCSGRPGRATRASAQPRPWPSCWRSGPERSRTPWAWKPSWAPSSPAWS